MSKTLRATLLLGLAGVIYGAFLIITKIANNNGYTREDLFAGQYLFATAVFAVIVLAKYRHERVGWKNRLQLAMIGVFGAGVNYCLYETVLASGSSFSVAMLFQCIWMGIAFDALVTRKLPPVSTMTAGALIIIGMPLATGILGSEQTLNTTALIWGFGAAICYTGMLWTTAHYATSVHPVVRTFHFAATQAIFASITAPQFYLGAVIDPVAWSYAIPLGLSTGVIPVFLIMKNSPFVPVGITTIMLGMEMPSAFFLEMLILHTEQTALSIAGALLICAGIVVANKRGFTELAKRKQRLPNGDT